MKKKVFCQNIEAGQKQTSDPRLVEEIVKDFLANSNSPFAVAYRQQQARQARRLTTGGPEVLNPNTMLCVDVKTWLRHDLQMKHGKCYTGTLRLDADADEYRYAEHLTFTEDAPRAYRRNPQVFDGRHITITRWPDGSLHPHLKPKEITTGFDIVSYASEVANELVWALESLVEK